jgi:hypothetical protein
MVNLQKRICPFCLVPFETEQEKKKFCTYAHTTRAHDLIKIRETFRLTDEERIIRERLLKWKRDGGNTLFPRDISITAKSSSKKKEVA